MFPLSRAARPGWAGSTQPVYCLPNLISRFNSTLNRPVAITSEATLSLKRKGSDEELVPPANKEQHDEFASGSTSADSTQAVYASSSASSRVLGDGHTFNSRTGSHSDPDCSSFFDSDASDIRPLDFIDNPKPSSSVSAHTRFPRQVITNDQQPVSFDEKDDFSDPNDSDYAPSSASSDVGVAYSLSCISSEADTPSEDNLSCAWSDCSDSLNEDPFGVSLPRDSDSNMLHMRERNVSPRPDSDSDSDSLRADELEVSLYLSCAQSDCSDSLNDDALGISLRWDSDSNLLNADERDASPYPDSDSNSLCADTRSNSLRPKSDSDLQHTPIEAGMLEVDIVKRGLGAVEIEDLDVVMRYDDERAGNGDDARLRGDMYPGDLIVYDDEVEDFLRWSAESSGPSISYDNTVPGPSHAQVSPLSSTTKVSTTLCSDYGIAIAIISGIPITLQSLTGALKDYSSVYLFYVAFLQMPGRKAKLCEIIWALRMRFSEINAYTKDRLARTETTFHVYFRRYPFFECFEAQSMSSYWPYWKLHFEGLKDYLKGQTILGRRNKDRLPAEVLAEKKEWQTKYQEKETVKAKDLKQSESSKKKEAKATKAKKGKKAKTTKKAGPDLARVKKVGKVEQAAIDRGTYFHIESHLEGREIISVALEISHKELSVNGIEFVETISDDIPLKWEDIRNLKPTAEQVKVYGKTANSILAEGRGSSGADQQSKIADVLVAVSTRVCKMYKKAIKASQEFKLTGDRRMCVRSIQDEFTVMYAPKIDNSIYVIINGKRYLVLLSEASSVCDEKFVNFLAPDAARQVFLFRERQELRTKQDIINFATRCEAIVLDRLKDLNAL
ncbi:hypothetical protein DFH11DRAFT_1550800 [Phellopilus nigrolimitatus]|nr:hypothetical protein DFH11DRAFT_1550800 [Phellopilus nigrolimitatus]